MDTNDVYRLLKVFIGQRASMTWPDVGHHYSSVTTGKVGHQRLPVDDPISWAFTLRKVGDHQPFPDQLYHVAEA